MEIRRRVMGFLVRSQEAYMPIAMLMQSMTLTLVAYQYIAWRGIGTYQGIALIFLMILTGLLAWGYIFVEKLGLFRAKRRTMATMDPAQVYAFTPLINVLTRTQGANLLRLQIKVAEGMGLDVGEEKEALERLERWLAQGYIPRAEYPEDLQHYYTVGDGHRL